MSGDVFPVHVHQEARSSVTCHACTPRGDATIDAVAVFQFISVNAGRMKFYRRRATARLMYSSSSGEHAPGGSLISGARLRVNPDRWGIAGNA